MAIGSNPSSKTRTSVVEVVALLVIIALVFWFFVRPQAASYHMQQDQLKQAEVEYQNVGQDKADLARLADKLKQSSHDIILVDEALPLQNRATQLEVLLDSFVAASGLSLAEMNVQAGENVIVAGNKQLLTSPYNVGRKLQTTQVDLSVKGNIDQFHNLLQLLETSGRLIDVTSLNMTNDAEAITFKLKLKAYSYVP